MTWPLPATPTSHPQVLIEVYRIVRKNLESNKYNPERPAPSMIGTLPLMPDKSSAGCC